mgnify:CR=1 FL=1
MTDDRPDPAAEAEIDVKRPPKPRMAWAWVALACVMALTLALAVPILEADSNVHRWVALLPIGMATLLGGGLAWLILTVLRRRRG